MLVRRHYFPLSNKSSELDWGGGVGGGGGGHHKHGDMPVWHLVAEESGAKCHKSSKERKVGRHFVRALAC